MHTARADAGSIGDGMGPVQAHTAPMPSAGWTNRAPPDAVTAAASARNNVFYVGQPVTSALTGAAAATYEVRDYWGRIVAEGPAAPSLTVAVAQPGWYKLYLYRASAMAPWGDGCVRLWSGRSALGNHLGHDDDSVVARRRRYGLP